MLLILTLWCTSLSDSILDKILQLSIPMLHFDKINFLHSLLFDLMRKKPSILRSLGNKIWLLRLIIWYWKKPPTNEIILLSLVSARHWNTCKHFILSLKIFVDIEVPNSFELIWNQFPERKCCSAKFPPVVPAYMIQVL